MLRETSETASTAKYLFQWMVSQANVWYLLYRCAEYVNKTNAPLQSSATALDQLLLLGDSETEVDTESGARMEGGISNAPDVENRQVPETSWWRSEYNFVIFFQIIICFTAQ